jgi:O-antigen/teichoic acid export membrane protein
MLGPNWIAAIPLIQILAFSGAIAILETNIGAVYLAMGRPKILTLVYTLFASSFVFLLILLVPQYGPTGAAKASLYAALANIPLQVYLMRRTLGINLRDLAAVFFRPIAASGGMFWIARIIIDNYSVGDATAVQIPLLATVICLSAIAYVAIDLMLWFLAGRPSGPESYIMSRIRERWNV